MLTADVVPHGTRQEAPQHCRALRVCIADAYPDSAMAAARLSVSGSLSCVKCCDGPEARNGVKLVRSDVSRPGTVPDARRRRKLLPTPSVFSPQKRYAGQTVSLVAETNEVCCGRVDARGGWCERRLGTTAQRAGHRKGHALSSEPCRGGDSEAKAFLKQSVRRACPQVCVEHCPS